VKRRLNLWKRSHDEEPSHSHVAPPDHSQPDHAHPIIGLQHIIGNAALLRQLNRTPQLGVTAGTINHRLRAVVQRDDETEVSEPVSDNAMVDLDPSMVESLSLQEVIDLKKVVESDILIAQKDELIEPIVFETSRSNLKTIHLVLAEKLKDRFGKLPQNIGIPTSPEDQIEFLDSMSAYLGSYDDVLTHYEDIKPATAPGSPMLHKNARAALEAVNTELGGEIPSTGVAAAIRGRFRPNNKEPMGHPLGFALDYRAVDNPRIGDSDTLTLLRMDTGGKVNFDLGMSRSKRRDFIGEMQAGTADQTQMESFFAKFDSEYERVAKASEKFGETLGADAKTEMKTLRDRYFKNMTEKYKIQQRLNAIAKALKAKKNQAPDKQTALTDEQTQLTEQLTPIDEDQALVLEEAQVILQPWLDQIQEKKTKIEEANPDVFDGSVVDESKLSKPERKRRDYARGEWNVYDSLEKRLSTDLSFLFGKLEKGKPKHSVASEPSVTQLLERGFFNPDEEPTGTFSPSQHGFNLTFMKAMAKHGFDQGVCWEGASQDSMHFDYVPDYDNVVGKAATKTSLSRLTQIYYGKKKQVRKKKRRGK
jgi:hypothetical protein